jgi:MFS family permease
MKPSSWRTPIVVLVCGTAILFLSFGLRQNFGLYLAPISTDLGWGREVFAFAVAFQSLVWGISTPIFGFLADRFGPAKVVSAGGALYAGGLYVMSQATAPIDATIGVGVLTGFALSMAGFPIVLSVVSRSVAATKRSAYLGIASAGGSSGQLVLVPLGQWFITDHGWVTAIIFLAVMAALIVPLSAALAGGNRRAADDVSNQRIGEALREAGSHSGYKLLTAGYFVCGFQTMFIGAHLPAYLTDLGQPAWLGATALSLIGLFNIFGCIAWGNLGGRFPKKYLLSTLYFLRSIVMAIFMLVPITPTTVVLFTSIMGLLWLGTVPLTTGLVAQIFGTKFMATLVGLTFLSHQIGSFLGIWLGGVTYDLTGNYDPIFWGGVLLGVVAAFVHYPIDDRPLLRPSETVKDAIRA